MESTNLIARIISFTLFPLLMPLYGVCLLFNLSTFSYYPVQYIKESLICIILVCILIPFLSYYILEKTKIISSIQMIKKEDRIIPYAITSLSYLICAYLLYFKMPLFVINILIGISIAILIDAIISKWWKISAHMTGIGGLISSIYAVSLITYTNSSILLSIAFICAGALAAARLQLKRHTPLQLLAGFANGYITIQLTSLFNWDIVLRAITNFF